MEHVLHLWWLRIALQHCPTCYTTKTVGGFVVMWHWVLQIRLEHRKKLEDHPNGCLLRGIHFFWSNYSDLTRPHPKWWFSKGNPLISGKPRLVKYYNLARFFVSRLWVFFFVLNFCLLIMVPSRFSWFLITNYLSWCLSTWLGSFIFPNDLLLKGPHGN